jgi:hypothetical protein
MRTPLYLLLLLLFVSRCLAYVAITTTSLPNGTVNKAYSASIYASGGCTPYTWTITSGSLPAGITKKVSSTTTSLNLSGTPTSAATSSFTVAAKGCGGNLSTHSYKIVIQSSSTSSNVTIKTTTIPNGTVNTAYSASILAAGGCTPYKWAIASGSLPAGLTARASSTTTTLNLSGTPTTAKSYPFSISVTGCGGNKATDSYTVVIQSSSTSGNVAIKTTTIPNGTVNTAYSASILAAGGCTPYKWAIASGSLPAGITARASSTTTALNLSGTPTTAKSYPFSISVTGCGGNQSSDSYTVVIQSGANHLVDLSWKASTSTNIAGYNVYRSPDGVNWKKENVSLIASTLYSDSTVSNGSTYYYAAPAVDISGKESSKTASVKVTVP